MKKTIFILLAVCLYSFMLQAQPTAQQVESKITDVTVYMRGAMVTEKATVNLKKGKLDVVFTNIPVNTDEANIHIKAPSMVKILAVTRKPMEQSLDAKESSGTLGDSLLRLRDRLQEIIFGISAYQDEKNLLLANQSIGGSNTGVKIEDLQKAAEYFRTRISNINQHQLQLQAEKRKVDMAIRQASLAESRQRIERQAISQQVVVTLYAPQQVSAPLELEYLTWGAGWAPAYDVRVTGIENPLKLHYKGKVFNNSGKPWVDVKLTLSTADPEQSANKPQLTPWTLNFDSRKANRNYNAEGRLNTRLPNSIAGGMTYYYDSAISQVQFSQVQVSELSVNFEVVDPANIPSDSRPYAVEVQTYSLPASYQYFSVPKLDRDAFLTASFTGWERMNLIPGPVSVYFADNYIGESYIDTRFAGDSLEVSLGRDSKVTVTRNKREDFSKEKFIGSNKVDDLVYEITLRNNNNKPVEIELVDQVPVSQEGDIKVDINEISDAALDPLNGKLTWKLTLQPQEVKKYTISFSVKYPKYSSVEIRKWRDISCPTF